MNSIKNIPELFSDLVEHLSTLFRKELHLAKAEAREKVNQAVGAAASIAIGGVVLLGAFLMLLHSAVAWLVILGLEVQWSTLVVGVVVALIGYVMLRKGINNLKASNLTPERTVTQLRNDARTAKEQI